MLAAVGQDARLPDLLRQPGRPGLLDENQSRGNPQRLGNEFLPLGRLRVIAEDMLESYAPISCR